MKPLSDDVRDLGRKARERLVQERRKRPEIMRLTALPPTAATTNDDAVPEKPTTTTMIPAKKAVALKPRPKRKRKSSYTATARTKNSIARNDNDHNLRDTADPSVDGWMPSVAHIQAPTSKKDRSTVVLLHGLPVGTTPRRIQSFFSGLDPRRIAFLVPILEDYIPCAKSTSISGNITENKVTILEIDADYSSNAKRPRIERYLPHQLRIMVQFRSAPTAFLAVQRSGEILTLPSNPSQGDDFSMDDDDNGQYKRGAAIAVTPMRKPWSSFLGKYLAIDVTHAYWDEPLYETQMRIMKPLDSNVLKILWNGGIQNLHLTIRANKTNVSSSSPYVERKNDDHSPATNSIRWYAKSMLLPADGEEATGAESATARSKLEQHLEFLKREISRLRNHAPFPFAEAPDPALLRQDPVLKLTSSAMQILVDEMNRIQHALQVHSRWKWLRISNTTSTNEKSTL
jgi:hypothetical protein